MGSRRSGSVEGPEIAGADREQRPLAVQAIPALDPRDRRHARERRFPIDTKIGIEVFLSADAKEGPLAFRRAVPQFQGR